MPPPEVIDADVVVLRRWRREFADAAVAAIKASLDELIPFMPWASAAYDREAAIAFVEHSDNGWTGGSEWNYAIFTPDDDFVGSTGLHDRVGPGALEIGYWIRSDHTGRGYATMSVVALAEAALTLPGINQVVIRHDAANAKSGAVAARAGFREVDRRPGEIAAPGAIGIEVTWVYP